MRGSARLPLRSLLGCLAASAIVIALAAAIEGAEFREGPVRPLPLPRPSPPMGGVYDFLYHPGPPGLFGEGVTLRSSGRVWALVPDEEPLADEVSLAEYTSENRWGFLIGTTEQVFPCRRAVWSPPRERASEGAGFDPSAPNLVVFALDPELEAPALTISRALPAARTPLWEACPSLRGAHLWLRLRGVVVASDESRVRVLLNNGSALPRIGRPWLDSAGEVVGVALAVHPPANLRRGPEVELISGPALARFLVNVAR